ncbi:MAG: GtrA family protein [Anaerolineae bacterium]|nr:MAG: GtrA family protein [Anaerolineae bacterium]
MNVLNRKERIRFLRFAVVGTIGAVVDFGTFNLLNSLLGIQAVIASVISFTAAVTSNFIWHRYWTYPDSRSKPVAQQMTQFAFVSVIGLSIRTPIFAALEPLFRRMFATRLHIPLPLSADFLGHNLALAVAVGIVMLWNFFVNRYWTYNDVD